MALAVCICFVGCSTGSGYDDYDDFEPAGVYIIDLIGGTKYPTNIDNPKFAQTMFDAFESLEIDTNTEGKIDIPTLVTLYMQASDFTGNIENYINSSEITTARISSNVTGTIDALVQNMVSKGNTTNSIAHLTCVSSTKEDVHRVINDIKEKGIQNILALRGDIPKDAAFPLPNHYKYN